ncbi:uncharacterized protein LOC109705334 [Ananas comosus]|uniref:Uncharacterized protein LOC109705334 n=1 Tax=Ananas comosus TaxID=4615 RepID=A0A6P5EDY5_ANACO|nr:uncharacterized protein LOC109705334 [Ananas comosus]
MSRFFGDSVEVEDLIEWENYILSRYTTQLCRAGILGGIVASRGKYNKNINIIKALVELWCSETNTFHLPYGEVGISLWEIRGLSGLPIIGDMYDEYILPNSELYNKNNYPNCVRELFDIYEWLIARSSNKRVRYDLWVNFFYTSCKKLSRSKSRNISNRELAPSYTEDTTRATYISLWLCNFVMPSWLDHFIRPETFIMASKLALGERVALAPAILCAIHAGLSFMSDHPEGPAHPGPQFPVSFLYTWIGLHFEQTYSRKVISDNIKNIAGLQSHPQMILFMDAAASPFNAKRARIHLRSSSHFVWRPLPYSYSFVNDGWLYDAKLTTGECKYPKEVYEYIISIRQSVLPLRLGNKLHTQPYNPHRFARQFGFDQSFPESINVPKLANHLGTLAGCWNHFLRYGTSTNYFIPKEDRIGKPTLHYTRWWSNSVHSSFKHGVGYLLNADDPRKKKKKSVMKNSTFEGRLNSSNVINERVLNSPEPEGKQLDLFPEYDHIQAGPSDDSSQFEVIGLSFPIHEDDRYKKSKEVLIMDSPTGESQIGKSGSIEDDISPYDDELVSKPSPPKDPLTDVADIGVSSFSEACATHHEDEGAKKDDDSIVEKSKNEAITESPSLGKRERVIDISTIEIFW